MRIHSTSVSALVIALVAVAIGGTARAGVIRSNLLGSTTSNAGFVWGESVVTPSGGPWDDLQFNFFDPNGAPEAVGNVYLLSSEYLGTPSGLSSLTPGFVAEGAGDGSVYTFAPGVTIQQNTEYWLYTDSTLVLVGNSWSGVVGEQYYAASGTGANFAALGSGINYVLSGDVPEPASLALLGAGIAGLAAARRRRR